MRNFHIYEKPVEWFQLRRRAAGLCLGADQGRAGYGFVWRMGGKKNSMTRRERQSTICRELTFEGVGLHSGVHCKAKLLPAEAGEGILFRRVDLEIANNVINASPMNVVAADHGTTLANEAGVRISTIEHLMAALALCGVDNVLVEVDGPEIPILDGSSAQFVSAIAEAGCAELPAWREPYLIFEPIMVEDEDRFIEFSPGPRRIEIKIVFEDCMIGSQSLALDLENDRDLAKLASARTFCRLKEVEYLREAGLIRGGTLANSIVVDGDRVLNDDPLRDPQEFVLHKALDLIGDLHLVGAPIEGTIRAVRPGHYINTRAARALMRQTGAIDQELADESLRAAMA